MSTSSDPATFKMVSPAIIPLGLGLLATSSMFFGNIGLSLCGPLPIISEQIGASGLTTSQRIRVWRLFFDRATTFIVGGVASNTILNLSVPFLTESQAVRNLALISAASTALVLPYTVAFIANTNKALIQLDDRKVDVLSEGEQKRAVELIAKWDKLHRVRYIFYGSAWASGLAAVVGSFAGI
ncbi:hypothetical protein LSUE1_G005938 [Lachnellula suecica]|uniref:DUF1772-domain-containing protein n=1 Tax=Lachnellula suecica TaxID=602035 RepID=A0A8T9C8T4_9HELO|nr:hypothetical protein LSUE1_G005938 [Lachnellula suecica]